MTGLEFIKAIVDGDVPPPPMALTLGMRLVEAEEGRALFVGEPRPEYYNPMGVIHGGWPAALLDSCMGCAVHTTLPEGSGYTTIEIKIDLMRTITAETGEVFAEGNVVKVGRRVGFADGTLRDSAGKLLARGTTSCLIMSGVRD